MTMFLRRKDGIRQPKRGIRVLAVPILAGIAFSLTSCGYIAEALNEASSGSDAAAVIPATAPRQESGSVSDSETSQTDNPLPSEEAPVSEEASRTEAAVSQSEEVSKPVGIRPEFKEAMDSYEAFYEEYVDFLKKYESSENTLGMLSDYMDYLSEYAEMNEKLDALDTDDLSAEETAYYIEVTTRITKLLGELY